MKFLLVFVLVMGLVGCDDEIGDSCSSNIDCSSKGNRLCDTSQPGGYCTVAGCSAGSCPGDSVCVAFYPPLALVRECDPATEDLLGSDDATDDCAQDERCLSTGYCAPVSLERRFCMKKCSSNGDCRDKYTCRTTGDLGSQKVPRDDENYDTVKTARFCVVKP